MLCVRVCVSVCVCLYQYYDDTKETFGLNYFQSIILKNPLQVTSNNLLISNYILYLESTIISCSLDN